MKGKIKKSFLILTGAVILIGSSLVFSEPGSEGDPLISLSYLDNKVKEIYTYIDNKVSNSNGGSNSSNELEIVEIKEGEYLLGKAGTEIILRGGKATVVAGTLGGLSDVTGGDDLEMDMSVPHNHLLIIPRNDGRGVLATTDAIFMVRGEFEVK